jgi:hypothetical protein
MDKFMERPKSQKAAASGLEGLSDDEEFPISDGEDEGAALAATSSSTLSQLLEQQKSLADQIAVLRAQDF